VDEKAGPALVLAEQPGHSRRARRMTNEYLSGFGNEFATEALPGALPKGQNTPQHCPYGLYAEQISGTPFTAPRASNGRSWLYRIRPSVTHMRRFTRIDMPLWKTAPQPRAGLLPLGPLRWSPPPMPNEASSFVCGLSTMTTAGSADLRLGMAAHFYFVGEAMLDDYFMNADGELLILPETGGLRIATELGELAVGPCEIAVIPRGIKFKVAPESGPSRGYVCENYGSKLALPELGPIGANGLANRRDFVTPVAAYEDKDGPCRLTVKWGGGFHRTDIDHSPLDVVAWHGNYAPYKYDLKAFSPVGAVLVDHPDPSIYTVLTSASAEPGIADVDFVVFADRWLVAEHTFRPPWYHTNCMSELMGLIEGRYDAKPEGFLPGGLSLHNAMLPHGPDAAAYAKATSVALAPEKLEGGLAFMLESRFPHHPTEYAATLPTLQADYEECWRALPRNFEPADRSGTGI
jgi:homogentisate 1,2-dioxygenase